MSRSFITITLATTPEQIQTARSLFEEYARGLNFSLCFQNFSQELEELPGCYAPPSGRLFLGYVEAQAIGCVAIRRIDSMICEMKRLYISPAFRGAGLGRALSLEAIYAARQAGYKSMRLDSVESMVPALTLYHKLGFRTIAPYYHNPLANVVFLQLEL